MPDAIFAEPRLAEIYDHLDSLNRPDLVPYLAIADEFNAQSVIDLGCGTGSLACRFAALGKEVVGIDPAIASLDIAQRKTYADRVCWITGTVAQLKGLQADLIIMTGNVPQVFITDEEWMATLCACRDALTPNGRLVFEMRDPAKEAWKDWNQERSFQRIEAPGIGIVETWVEIMHVQLPLVSFCHIFVFRKDGKVMTSESTLRFRTRSEVADALSHAQLAVESVRDASDRPGLEFVFIARR